MSYDPQGYWQERYRDASLRSSGHRDLPEAYNLWLYKRKRQVLQHAIRDLGRSISGARVLEVGVGLGAYVEFFRAAGAARFVGTDIVPHAVSLLRQRYSGVEFIERDVTEPGLRDAVGEFDLVAALDVFYHVVDDRKLVSALGFIAEALAPNGLLAIHDVFLHRPSEDHGYIRWRSLEDWERLLASANLVVADRRPIYFTMVQANETSSRFEAALLEALWRLAEPFRRRLPGVAGAAAFVLDNIAGFVRREGPSMELMLVRKRVGET